MGAKLRIFLFATWAQHRLANDFEHARYNALRKKCPILKLKLESKLVEIESHYKCRCALISFRDNQYLRTVGWNHSQVAGPTVGTVCSPNEDLGRRNKRWGAHFRLSFQRFVAQIEYSRPWKVLPSKSGFHLLFILPKSSFGMDKLFLKMGVGLSCICL